MTNWQPQYQPRHDAGRPPATAPQWQQQAPQPSFQPLQQPQYPPPRQPAWRPNPHDYRPPRQRPLPRYPRFPRLMPRSRRGPSVFHVVYLGTHPVALVMSLMVWCLLIEFWAVFAMTVVFAWLLQCSAVAVRRAAARRG